MSKWFKPVGKAFKARGLISLIGLTIVAVLTIYAPFMLLIILGWWARGFWIEVVRDEPKSELRRWIKWHVCRPVMRML